MTCTFPPTTPSGDVRAQQISEDISALMEEMGSIHLNWNLYNQLKSFLF